MYLPEDQSDYLLTIRKLFTDSQLQVIVIDIIFMIIMTLKNMRMLTIIQ